MEDLAILCDDAVMTQDVDRLDLMQRYIELRAGAVRARLYGRIETALLLEEQAQDIINENP